jgi:hypothetical protein
MPIKNIHSLLRKAILFSQLIAVSIATTNKEVHKATLVYAAEPEIRANTVK